MIHTQLITRQMAIAFPIRFPIQLRNAYYWFLKFIFEKITTYVFETRHDLKNLRLVLIQFVLSRH